jgi:tetratricopeptide (TPR) repeat protein
MENDSFSFDLAQAKRASNARLARISEAEEAFAASDWQTCASLSESVLQEDPEHVGALELLAKALWHGRQFETLMPVIARLVAANPFEPGYHALRGAALQEMGRYGDAVLSLERTGASGQLALAHLQEGQAGLVAALINEDPVFHAHYAQDPEGACKARGFAFAGNSQAHWTLERKESGFIFTRPS